MTLCPSPTSSRYGNALSCYPGALCSAVTSPAHVGGALPSCRCPCALPLPLPAFTHHTPTLDDQFVSRSTCGAGAGTGACGMLRGQCGGWAHVGWACVPCGPVCATARRTCVCGGIVYTQRMCGHTHAQHNAQKYTPQHGHTVPHPCPCIAMLSCSVALCCRV